MDLATILGITASIGGILLGQAIEGGSIHSIVQGTAAIIVFAGTIGACMVQFPGATLRQAVGAVKQVFKHEAVNMTDTINLFVNLAKKARRDGLVAIEKDVQAVTDPYVRRALELAVDGTESKALRATLEIELSRAEHHGEGPVKVFEAAGGYAPTVGILGAVLGLIHVMENLSDPTKLGAGIAVAFVATVYGVGSANLLFLPISGKLKTRLSEEMTKMEMVVEGVCAIAEGEHPRLIEKKLNAYAEQHGGTTEEAAGAAGEAARGAA